ncbi:hypothetical protein [Embleya sp. NPDC005971]|uniref:hypothetical protein n=1 Tax=Embleya sp. NPDC005971 TaxID=3156724 RepID=UPI0033F41BB9
MPRGRHRSVSTATRISLLAAICAPALVAVVLAVVAGGATTLRLAVLLGVLSAAGAIAWVVRGSTAHHRRLAEESIARRRERERSAEELRVAIERADEHELAVLQAGELAADHLVSRPQRLTPDLFARGAAVLDLLDRRAGEARPTAPSIVPAVRRPPVSAPDLVPAYAASVFGPAARPAARVESAPAAATRPAAPVARPAEPGRGVARPAGAPAPAAPAAASRADSAAVPARAESPGAAVAASSAPPAVATPAVPVPAGVSAPVADTPADTPGVASPPPAAAEPASSTPTPPATVPAPARASGTETAEVTRMVRDKVLEVTRRVAGSGASGRFDFFAPKAAPAEPEATGFLTDELFGSDARYDALVAGRPQGEEIEPAEATSVPDRAVDDIEADRLADPVRAEDTPVVQPTPVHRGQGVRFAPSESDRVRPGVPRPKPLPVDLTAHDDTEEIPRIDIRKHA